MKFDRRCFLSSAAGAALVGSVSELPGGDLFAQNFGEASLPPPEESGIEHIVVVMMENRSFDHLLGWLPNAEGMQAGLTYLDANGVAHATLLTSKVAATPTRTTPMRAGVCNTMAARLMGSCARARTTIT